MAIKWPFLPDVAVIECGVLVLIPAPRGPYGPCLTPKCAAVVQQIGWRQVSQAFLV